MRLHLRLPRSGTASPRCSSAVVARVGCLQQYRSFTTTTVEAMEQSTRKNQHAEAAWSFFREIGSPKYHVAPMVDQSELPFRLLCRNHGATAAYTPMLHSRLFLESAAYRAEHFTTCSTDRPLFAQFCANDPETLLKAAKLVEERCDAVDLNLGCPQRIAKRGRYGAFLMDDLDLVERIVRTLAEGLSIPVTCKIRIFPELQKTIAYAKMLEQAGASLVAVHGRTREQKTAREVKADWTAIKAVKEALTVPVLANGNIQTLRDVEDCLAMTGADGVMSAESLLEDPALFSPRRLLPGGEKSHLDGCRLLLEYLDLAEQYPCPARMVRGHAFKLLGNWLQEHTDLRDQLNGIFSIQSLKDLTREMQQRIETCGRTEPQMKLSERALQRLEREQLKRQRIEDQLVLEGRTVTPEEIERQLRLDTNVKADKLPRPYPPENDCLVEPQAVTAS